MVEIRATRPEERRAAADTLSIALLQAPPDDEAWEKSVPSWDDSDSLSAWDGDECLGHVAGYRVDTLVPGGARLATSAVTRVGVKPTARRRGLASTMMRQLLVEARDRGQVLASLRASEAVIYARFGFGIAGLAADVEFRPQAAGPIGGQAPGSVRLLPPGEILEVVPPLYDRLRRRPGAISRAEWMWRRYYEEALKPGGKGEFVALHLDPDGDADGFVHYQVAWDEGTSFEESAGSGELWDLIGASPAVELALWGYLADLDLVRRWKSDERPLDEVVRLAIPNQRGFMIRANWDEQWLRLLDVDAALSARTYGEVTNAVTVAVDDDLLDSNSGVWSIDANGAKRLGGVRADGADLIVDVRTLAATYLGGVRWSALAAAGRVQVNDAEALARADALFAVPEAPFCGSFF